MNRDQKDANVPGKRLSIHPANFVGVLGVCFLMSLPWCAVSPFLWFGQYDASLSWIPQTVAGSFLVGIVYLAIAWLRGKAPSPAFSVVIPAIGVIGFAHVSALTQPFYHSYYDVLSYTYTGLIWVYLFLPYFSIPIALVHAFALRWALAPSKDNNATTHPS